MSKNNTDKIKCEDCNKYFLPHNIKKHIERIHTNKFIKKEQNTKKSIKLAPIVKGYIMQSKYQTYLLLVHYISSKWEYIIQENDNDKEDLILGLNNKNRLYIQLKYNFGSPPDSFSLSSDFFKTFDKLINTTNIEKIVYICSNPDTLNKFWQFPKETIYKFYRLLKTKELKENINISSSNETITELYDKYINETPTQEHIDYVGKFIFRKTKKEVDVNDMTFKLIEAYITDKVKKSKHEEIKLKIKNNIDNLVTQKLSENGDKRKITRDDFLDLMGQWIDIENNKKTFISDIADFIRNLPDWMMLPGVLSVATFCGMIGYRYKENSKNDKSVKPENQLSNNENDKLKN